jgi:serine palmitoyltransferase
VEELCAEWEPEPLHAELTEFQRSWQAPLLLSSDVGREVTVNGRPALNLASLNFLGVAGEESIREACAATIHKYGVGSCGPRGFYGTIDVHLALEERLAAFMGTPEAILYSYDLATLPSVIPAFANAKDLIVADEGCGYAIQNGCHLSRARVLRFRHNDVADLERVLRQVAAEDRAAPRPLNRRFVIVEGIYANTGDVAPLAAVRQLKDRFRYRLVVDESVSLGVLGRGGRGAAAAAGLAPDDADIVGASLGNAVGGVGGFCAASREVVDHQRLSGLGYCFSASLPPYLASAALAALDVIESPEGAARRERVRAAARQFRAAAAAALPGLRVVGGVESADSPLVHLQLDPPPPPEAYDAGDLALQRVVGDCLAAEGVLCCVAKYSPLERARPPPSIRVALSAAHLPGDVERAVAALKASCARALRRP